MAGTAETRTSHGLRRDAIGLREVLFQSITDMAPGAAITASIPAGRRWPATIAVTLGIGLAYTPATAFSMVGTGIVIVLAAIYILMNAACIGFFARRRRRWNPVLHLIVPLLGIATFVPAWLTAAGIRVFSFVAPLSPPVSYMGAGVGGWMVLGVIYLIYLRFRDPRRITEVGMVHLEEEPDQAAT